MFLNVLLHSDWTRRTMPNNHSLPGPVEKRYTDEKPLLLPQVEKSERGRRNTMPATPDGLKFNLDDLLLEMASQDPMRLQYVDYVKQMLSTIDHTPDHPVYPVMIHDAILALDEDGGSTKDAISEFIALKYDVLPVVHPAKLIQQLNKLVKEEQVVLTSEHRYMLPVENAPLAKLKNEKMHLKKNEKGQRNMSKGDERNRISEAHCLNMEVDNELQIEETDGPPGFTNTIRLQDGQIKDVVEEKLKVTEKTEVLKGKSQLQGLTQTLIGFLNYEVNGPKESFVEGFEINNLSPQERMVLSENQELGITAKRFSQVNEGHLDLVEEEGFCLVKPTSRVDNEMPAEIIQGGREEIEALEEQSQQQGNAVKVFEDRMERESPLIVTEEILQIEQHPECEERNDSARPQIQKKFQYEEPFQPEQVHVSAIEAAEEQSLSQEQASATGECTCLMKLAKGIDDQRRAEEVQEGQQQIAAIGEQSQQQGNALGSLKVQVEVELSPKVTEEILPIKHPESAEMKGQTQPLVKLSYHDEGHSQFEKMQLIDVMETGEQSRVQKQASMEVDDQFKANYQVKYAEDLSYVEHSENEKNEYDVQNHVLQNLHVDTHPQLEQMHRVENEGKEEHRKLEQQTFKIVHGYVEAECQVQVIEGLKQLENHEDNIGDEILPEVDCNLHVKEHLLSEQKQVAGEADNCRMLKRKALKGTVVEKEANCKASEEPHNVDGPGNGEIFGEAQPCVSHGAVKYSQSDKSCKMTNNQGDRGQLKFEAPDEKKSQHEQQNDLRNKINDLSNKAEIVAIEPQRYEDMSSTSSPCPSHRSDHAMSSLSLLSFKDKLLDLLERTRGVEQEVRKMISHLPAMEVSTHNDQNPIVRAVPTVPESEGQLLKCPVYAQADSIHHDLNQGIELHSHQATPDVEILALKEGFQEQRLHVVSEASPVPRVAQGLDLSVTQDIVHDKAKTCKSEFVQEKQLEKSVPEVSNDNDQIPSVCGSEGQMRMCLAHAQVDLMQREFNQEIELPNHQSSPDVEILALKECFQKQGEHVETSLVPQNARGIDPTVKQLSQVQLLQDIAHDKAKILESEHEQNREIELRDHQSPEVEILASKECFQKPSDLVEPEGSLVPQNAQGIDPTVKQLSEVQLPQDVAHEKAEMPEAELAEELQQLETLVKKTTKVEMVSAHQPCQIEQEKQAQQFLQNQSPPNSESGNHAAAYDPIPNSEMPHEPQKMIVVDLSFQPSKQPEKKCLPGKPQQRQLRPRCPRPCQPHSYDSAGANGGSPQLSSLESRRKHKLEPPIHERPRKQRPRDVEESFQLEEQVSYQKQLGPQQELGSDMGKTQDQSSANTKAELLPPEHGKERKDEPLNRRRGRPPKPKLDAHMAGINRSSGCVKHDDDKPPAKHGRARLPEDAWGLRLRHQPKRQKKQPQDRDSRLRQFA